MCSLPDQQALIEQQAAEWVAALGAGLCPQTQRELDCWLAQGEPYRQAFAKAQRAWTLMSGLDSAALASPNVENRRSKKGHTLWVRGVVAIAASVLTIVTTAQLWFAGELHGLFSDYATAAAEYRDIELEDGSRIYLGPHSALDVQYREVERTVTLKRGIAQFVVAQESNRVFRPFVVEAGDYQATALGTEFVVDLLGDTRADFSVTEHSIRVSGASQPLQVEQGQQLRLRAEGVSEYSIVDASWATAWRQQRLIFDREPLADAVAKISRFSPLNIYIHSQALENLKVTGVFDTSDPQNILQAMAQEYGFDVKHVPMLATLVIAERS